MTTIQQGLLAYIQEQVPAAGIGYPLEIPQDGPYPAWAYQVIDDDQLLSHSGGTGFCKARIQIDLVVEPTPTQGAYEIASGLAQQIRAKLDGFRGTMGGLQVHYCKTTQSDDWAELRKLPAINFDVLINYKL